MYVKLSSGLLEMPSDCGFLGSLLLAWQETPQSPNCLSSCQVPRKIREGGVDDDKGMVNDTEGVQSLVEGEIAPCGIGFVFMW